MALEQVATASEPGGEILEPQPKDLLAASVAGNDHPIVRHIVQRGSERLFRPPCGRRLPESLELGGETFRGAAVLATAPADA